MSFDRDFDSQFKRASRSIDAKFWIIALTQLVWAVGAIAILGAFLWLVGHLVGAW